MKDSFSFERNTALTGEYFLASVATAINAETGSLRNYQKGVGGGDLRLLHLEIHGTAGENDRFHGGSHPR